MSRVEVTVVPNSAKHHCYATHHLEAVTDLRTIQHNPGHRSLTTTAIYVRVAVRKKDRTSKEPVDRLVEADVSRSVVPNPIGT